MCRYFDDNVLKLLDEGTFKAVYGPQITDNFNFENTIFHPLNFGGCKKLLEYPSFVNMLKSLAESFAFMYWQKPVDKFGGNWFKMIDCCLDDNQGLKDPYVLLTPLFKECPNAVYEYILYHKLGSEGNYGIIEGYRNDVRANKDILSQEAFERFPDDVGYDKATGMRELVTDNLNSLKYAFIRPNVDMLKKIGYVPGDLDKFFDSNIGDDEFDIVVRQMLGDTSYMILIQDMMIK